MITIAGFRPTAYWLDVTRLPAVYVGTILLRAQVWGAVTGPTVGPSRCATRPALRPGDPGQIRYALGRSRQRDADLQPAGSHPRRTGGPRRRADAVQSALAGRGGRRSRLRMATSPGPARLAV